MTRPAPVGAAQRAQGPPTRTMHARVLRVLRHEWMLAGLAATALALLLNRGALADPAHTLPRDIWDPSLNAYIVAWLGQALRLDPTVIWHINAFYPAPYGLAFSDAMLGYAPFGLIGTGPEAAVLRYNLLYIGAHALVLFGGYALARQLGLRPLAATLVGVALASAPWRLAQTGHLQVLSSGGMFLALAMLALGHGIRWLRPGPQLGGIAAAKPALSVRPGWAFAGWLVATWQVSLGFGIGLPFLYVLLGSTLAGAAIWVVRHRGAWREALPGWPLLVADAVGGLILATVAVLLAQPYLNVLDRYPYARRTAAWAELYSPPVSGLFLAPAESTAWGPAQEAARAALSIPGEMTLLPGFALYALAVAGLVFSVWPLRVRVGLAIGAAGFLVLSLGTNGPLDGHLGYRSLFLLPGFEAIRTPGRLIIWATLLLALLAAGAVGALGQRLAVRSTRPATTALVLAAVLLPTILVLLEGRGTTPHVPVPPAPPTLSTVEAPYLVLPTHAVRDMNLMLWSTDRFAPMVNGGSGLVPAELREVREVVATFPDAASVEHLREIGVRSVVVLPARAAGTPLAEAATLPIDGLPLSRQVYLDAVVFTLT